MSILETFAGEIRDIFGLSNKPTGAKSRRMKTAADKKPVRPQTRRISHAARSAHPSKPSKRTIAAAWAKLSGIVNTGETDLSTREGFGN